MRLRVEGLLETLCYLRHAYSTSQLCTRRLRQEHVRVFLEGL